MAETFFISDTHFGHKNILTFRDHAGNFLRPGFKDIDEMNEHIVEQWNKTVTKQDKIIHCGDVAFGKPALQLCHRLKGIKYLVLGNHDGQASNEYLKIFNKIYGVKYIGRNDAICTHVPIHPGSMRDFKVNIHGHTHANRIPDYRYFNVSVECIDYTPISLDTILALALDRPYGDFVCLSEGCNK